MDAASETIAFQMATNWRFDRLHIMCEYAGRRSVLLRFEVLKDVAWEGAGASLF